MRKHERDLLSAAEYNNVLEVKRLLGVGVNPNITGKCKILIRVVYEYCVGSLCVRYVKQ